MENSTPSKQQRKNPMTTIIIFVTFAEHESLFCYVYVTYMRPTRRSSVHVPKYKCVEGHAAHTPKRRHIRQGDVNHGYSDTSTCVHVQHVLYDVEDTSCSVVPESSVFGHVDNVIPWLWLWLCYFAQVVVFNFATPATT